MKMPVYEVIGEGLIAQGVTTVYGLMTSDNMGLLGHLEKQGIAIIRARTEHGAVCMADGHARATGEVAVVSIGAGPSAAMTGTALVTAQRRRTPLVMIAGDVPVAERHHLKRFDQAEFFRATAGHCLSVVSSSKVVQDTYEVFRHARSGFGPAILNIPVDLLESEIDVEDLQADWRFMSPAPEPPAPIPAPHSIDEAVALLAAAKRPIIVAGRGATSVRCRDLMTSIGDRVGALFGTSLQGQYLFEGPYYVGVVGTLALETTNRLLMESDLILAVGASLNVYTSGHGQSFPSAKIIHIDNRKEALGEATPVDIPIQGDARISLEAIEDGLRTAGVSGRVGFREAETVAAIAKDIEVLFNYDPVVGALDQRQVLDIIDRNLPAERRVVVDAGHFAFFVIDHIRLASPDERVWTADFASIGLALPVAIGVATALPDKCTVVFVGDGGFAMSLPELDTAVRHKLPLTIIVMNDDAYGAELRYLENREVSDHLARFTSPDFAKIAEGFGCQALTVRTLDELHGACKLIGKTKGPLLVDIRVDVAVINRQFRGRKNSAAGEK